MGLEADIKTEIHDSLASLESNTSEMPQLVDVSPKSKDTNASSDLQSSASAASPVVDIGGMTADKKAAGSLRAAAVSDVVNRMHSYAMPGFIHRPTKLTGRHTAVRSASCADDGRTSDNESDAVNTVKRLVSLHHPNI